MATNNNWNNQISAANSAITLNSGTNAVNISTDASAATVSVGTGAGAKVVTVGSQNTTSSLALQYGTADFTLASATGTVMSALDTGEITYPLQPAFMAYNSATDTNATGNSTTPTVTFDTEVIDQNGDYNSGTYTFTAPVTGSYTLGSVVVIGAITVGARFFINIITSNRTYSGMSISPAAAKTSGGVVGTCMFSLCDMDSSDTAYVTVTSTGEAANTQSIIGSASVITHFYGSLTC